jgi:hypothetical protein
MALLKIGEKPILSLNEETPTAAISRTLFDQSINYVLSLHPWKFATQKITLTKTDGGDFALPVNVLRVIDCDCALYQVSNNRVAAPVDTIEITAIIKVNPENMPSYFVNVATLYLAREFCMPLTGDQNLLRTIAALYESELRAAKFIDSTMSNANDIENFSLISARF